MHPFYGATYAETVFLNDLGAQESIPPADIYFDRFEHNGKGFVLYSICTDEPVILLSRRGAVDVERVLLPI
jgi:hypothetical protein